jgi:hypothetical protein
MFKKIILAGILLISIAAANAKNVTAFKFVESIPGGIAPDDPLVSRMAADEAAKKYYMSNVGFANKVLGNKAGSLFLKYIQGTITEPEKAGLFSKLNMSQEELNAFGVRLGNEARAFMSRYPEMKQISEKQQREILVNVFRKISIEVPTKLSSAITYNVTPQECFYYWMVCNTLCVIGCSWSETNSCYWECASLCAVQYGACWFVATE